MQVYLYQNFVKKHNSTLQPTSAPVTKTVRLKEETSISSPIFLLSNFDAGYNYIYVPSWSRYYFITDVVKNIEGVFEISCECDRLATFKNEISNYIAFIERTSDSTQYNVDILDNALTVEDVVEHQAQATTQIFAGADTYILRVVGRDTSGIGTFAFNGLSAIGNIFNPVFSNMFDDGTFDWSTLTTGDLVQSLLCDPSKYVIGAYYSPLGLGAYAGHGGLNEVFLGFFPTGQQGLQVSTNPIYTQTVTLSKPSGIYTDFRKTDPAFSSYTLYIPAIGTVNISPDIIDSTLTLDISVDLLTGEVFYKLNSDGSLVSTYKGNCYASLQIGSGDASGGNAIISGGLEALSGIAQRSPIVVGKGVIDGIKSAISPTPSINGAQSGIAALRGYPNAILSVLQKHSAEFPINVYGRPCCKNLRIGTLNGFIKCANSSINIAGYGNDKDIVNNYLDGGFYYE